MRYILIPITHDLPDKLSDLSLALDYGIESALGEVYSYGARKEVMEKLITATGYEIVERDE